MAHWSGIGIPKTNAIALEVSYTHNMRGNTMRSFRLHRRNQAAETLNERVCRFFLELNTTSAPKLEEGYDLWNGVVFRLRSKNVYVQITSLELDLNLFENTEVKVFTKVGEFTNSSDLFAYPDEWLEVTQPSAVARTTSERKTLIIPPNEFNTIVMEPKESRLVYIAFPSEDQLVAAANEGFKFNQAYAKSDALASHVGYGVVGQDYFGVAVENRPFHGLVHYETRLPCEDQRDEFFMDLPYFVDTADPKAIIVSATTVEVGYTVTRALARDATLIRMQNFGGLYYQNVATKTEVVPHEGPCPFNWKECSKVVTTVHFGHNDQLDPGIAQYEILKYAAKTNVSSYPFELGYVGKVPLRLDYFITLAGAPDSFELDKVQRAYYGIHMARFLADVTGEEILAADLAPAKRNVPPPSKSNVFGNNNVRRDLQQSATSTSAKIHTSIYGAYPAWPEPQHSDSIRGVDSIGTAEILQIAFDNNSTVLVDYFTEGLIRPGPIHEDNRESFFSAIAGMDAELDESSLWFPTSAPTAMPTMDPDAEPEVWGMPQSTVKILSILMLIIGSLCLVVNIYWELQHRKEEKEKLKRNARAAQRKVDKLRAEHYRRIALKKRNIQNGRSLERATSDDDDSMLEPMIS